MSLIKHCISKYVPDKAIKKLRIGSEYHKEPYGSPLAWNLEHLLKLKNFGSFVADCKEMQNEESGYRSSLEGSIVDGFKSYENFSGDEKNNEMNSLRVEILMESECIRFA
ncbi:hypothetical protein NPIL_209931 [Nephila pilipes]|uniref:Uncharacterized protein n=1 Tax=Nephila pilipes TaxID=299642 RepID=A0A8X6TZK6_NEPPI|nr:hypothetical protein NPIL_209931 [Nephila pilipes]